MLRSMHVENYQCLARKTYRLGPRNVLHGPSGTGKTAFLKIVSALRTFLAEGAWVGARHVFPSHTKTFNQSEMQMFEVHLDIDDNHFQYGLVVDQSGKFPCVHSEQLRINNKLRLSREYAEVIIYADNAIYADGASSYRYEDDVEKYRAAVRSQRTLLMFPPKESRQLRAFLNFWRCVWVVGFPQNINATLQDCDLTNLKIQGKNWNNFYRQTEEMMHLERSKQLLSNLQKIVPNLKSTQWVWADTLPNTINTRQTGELMQLVMIVENSEGECMIPFHHLSRGQQTLFVLYCILYSTTRNCFLFLDSPDAGVTSESLRDWLEHARYGSVKQMVLVLHEGGAGIDGLWDTMGLSAIPTNHD